MCSDQACSYILIFEFILSIVAQLAFTTSNVSMAFPYVTIDEQETLEDSLVKGFTENCRHRSGVNRIACLNTCSINGGNIKKLEGLHSLNVN